jgi:hypothetical protein
MWIGKDPVVRNLEAIFGSLPAARARLSSISPAWSLWIAHGRIGFMSTQRRNGRSVPPTDTGRWKLRHGSRLAHDQDRANRAHRSGHAKARQANAVPLSWNFPAYVFQQAVWPVFSLAMAVRAALRQDDRNQQRVRHLCPALPPLRQAAAHRPILDRRTGYPPTHFPAVFALLHSTLPQGPAAFCCRTERYDGKRNLHFQHAA